MTGTQTGAARGALDGLRVLDLSRGLAGPWAGQILGDLGAEVIKVERPGRGDDTRAWGPPYLNDGQGAPTSESAYYLSANRNKQSVTIDITRPEGQRLVKQLVAESDVLLENFKVGGLKRYGLDYASLAAINPRLIYCSITGFGQDGPYAERPGYDFLIQGLGGHSPELGILVLFHLDGSGHAQAYGSNADSESAFIGIVRYLVPLVYARQAACHAWEVLEHGP